MPPATIERLAVGVVDQIPAGNPLPAEIFSDLGPGLLVLDGAARGLTISLTVSSYSRKPFTFRAVMFGDVMLEGEQRGPDFNVAETKPKG